MSGLEANEIATKNSFLVRFEWNKYGIDLYDHAERTLEPIEAVITGFFFEFVRGEILVLTPPCYRDSFDCGMVSLVPPIPH